MSEAAAGTDGAVTADTTNTADVVDNGVEGQADDAEVDGGNNRREARYRRQLRDTEAQLTAANERLGTMHRAHAERLAAEHLADPADLWRDGAELTGLLDDNGNVDDAKVAELAAATAAAHPHWRRPVRVKTRRDIDHGRMLSGATNHADHRPPSWQGVLRGSGE